MFDEIIKIKDVVKELLIQYPETRDNDNLLMLKVWRRQYPGLPNSEFSTFANYLVLNKFKSPESIRRSRQKIQEQNPHLRGKLREQRKKEAEKVRTLIVGVET